MHWLLVRLLRAAPELPSAEDAVSVLDAHLAPGPLAVERAYFDGPGGRTFERPYGWAWLLELQAEALRSPTPGRRRAAGRERWLRWPRTSRAGCASSLEVAAYPMRAGTHGNSAFACILALDYARTARDAALAAAIDAAARKWYLADRDAPRPMSRRSATSFPPR